MLNLERSNENVLLHDDNIRKDNAKIEILCILKQKSTNLYFELILY